MENIFQPTQCLSREELEHYAKGDISKELRYTIENHLVDCPLCSEAMEGYQAMEENTDVAFDEMFQKIDAKVSTKKVGRSTTTIPWNQIAAGLLFLFTVGSAYWYYQDTNATNKYMAYFENQDSGLTTRGINEDAFSADLKAGVNLFANENYQGSLSFFEDYLESNPESAIASYYAGLSSSKIGETEMAIEYLTTVRLNDDSLYEEATWRLVEIHLAREEKAEAKQLLKDLLKVENGFFEDQAKKLFEELS